MFSHIKIFKIRAYFSAAESGRLPPYLGSTLRGILGHCLRDFVCDYPTLRCNMCANKDNCNYAQCFCSPGNKAGAVNPYVLHALTNGKTEWKPGDLCIFDLTLIGKITQYIGVFLDALQEMGRRGWGVERIPFRLQYAIDPEKKSILLNNNKTWMRNITIANLSVTPKKVNGVMINFDTPVRILIKKELCHALSFKTLIHSLSRRIALLSHAYADEYIKWNEAEMLEAADEVKTTYSMWRDYNFARYSINHEDNKLLLPAIMGLALYEGDITPFTPLLEAGRLLHAGKNSTIGFGHFTISYDR